MTCPSIILAFDTSGPHCAAVVLRGDEVVAQCSEAMTKGQAERLFGVLDTALQSAGVAWHEITRIGVGVGPGNFTGIRIAVAAARGLAMSLDIPAIGVSGFEVAAWGQDRPVTATITAPRDQLYHQTFAATRSGAATPPALSPADALPAQANQVALENLTLVERLRRVGLIALNADDTTPPAPLYVRPADAAPPKDPPPLILPGGPTP